MFEPPVHLHKHRLLRVLTLALARSAVVDKHGGTIRFESTEGEGTTFIIRLPLKG